MFCSCVPVTPRAAFAETMRMMTQRISVFTSLPLASLEKLSLQKRLEQIGSITPKLDH